ncbi:chemotaxis protein CheB [Leptolyngbya ohadii]|uniref:chemotaxis protein CheB n=1 Tax=Leptolyngbya ohadii TaxID=1962290 RepID=UPI0021F19E69|nr:chemotaxis protein CheB [Leptolyngbya ohadii]
MGTSLGGLSALRTVLGSLPGHFPAPIAIVQHRHKESDHTLPCFLQQFVSLPIREVEDKDEIQPGWIYLAPADYHLLVEAGHFSLSTDDPVSYARPSIDVLFESAAEVYGSQVVGVVMTGANQDGSRGLSKLKANGGVAIVQDPRTADSPVMPEAAIASVSVNWILPLDQIAPCLIRLCNP